MPGSGSRKLFEFRIVAGSLKGKKIVAPDLGITRPPLTRLRKSIFDYLVPYLPDASYLDLYSGTGSYLFEAVSRGAAAAEGVEIEGRLADSINDQAEKYGVADRLVCICDDLFKTIPALASAGKMYDIVMMAPPQYRGMISSTLKVLADNPVTGPESQIICQHDTSETDEIGFRGFKLLQQRRYGNTTFTILSGQRSRRR